MNANEPAFPKAEGVHSGTLEGVHKIVSSNGMSLREYIAIHVLPAAMTIHADCGNNEVDADKARREHTPKVACKLAVRMADALIAELNKETKLSSAGERNYDIVLDGGIRLTPEMSKTALREAMLIIETVGTTGIEHKHQQAAEWLRQYYPHKQ